MTRIFDSVGSVVPVTVLEVGPCHVIQVKNIEKDGYDAVQIGFMKSKDKHLTKPLIGHYKKNGTQPSKILAEFKKVPKFEYKPGQVFNVSLFNKGDFVSFKPGSHHSSYTKKGCTLLVFMRKKNKLL